MSRRVRPIIPGLPHHITQRGARKNNVFFQELDRLVYLELFRSCALRFGVEVISYCLMTNHVHYLLVPHEKDSIRWTIQVSHKRYADYINSMQGKTGHLWQGRFYSSPVDEQFLWVTLRYIERNPVEAGLVMHASEYKWSSASAHCGFTVNALLTKDESWNAKLRNHTNWYNWLNESDSYQQTMRLEQCTHRDLPCGSEQFLNTLETNHGLDVRLRNPGRPKKEELVYS